MNQSMRVGLALLLGSFVAPSARASDDAEPSTQAAALQLAGAFSNEGFKIRDGHWINSLAAGQPKLIQVNLYAGNQYWFIAAATDKAKKVTVSVFDELGKPLATDSHQDGNLAAAGFAPALSGSYYIQINEIEGAPATFCFLYTYK